MKEFFTLFCIQGLNSVLLSYNFRSIALNHTGHTAVATFFLSTMAYTVIRRISREENSLYRWLGYSTGSVAGNLLGIYISKII